MIQAEAMRISAASECRSRAPPPPSNSAASIVAIFCAFDDSLRSILKSVREIDGIHDRALLPVREER